MTGRRGMVDVIVPADSVEHGRATVDWLALREPADAAARSLALVEALQGVLGPTPPDSESGLVIHDLGSGTGAMRRWLTPRLPRSQRWVEHERDLGLLAGGRGGREPAVPGQVPEVSACGCDLAYLTADHLAQADLVTASALLDVLTARAVDRIIEATADLKVPLLLTLSVVGRVRLVPADPWDAKVMAAFNDHQRRRTSAGRLLGPDAVRHAMARLSESGAAVRVGPSPWQLTSTLASLAAAWFDGWVGAAVEQQPALAAPAAPYRARRLAEIADGRLEVTVEHADLLAWWP